MFMQSKDLFGLPTEVKETCSINSAKAGANRGWLSMHTETLDPTKQKVRQGCVYYMLLVNFHIGPMLTPLSREGISKSRSKLISVTL
jgi:hypothetical protein